MGRVNYVGLDSLEREEKEALNTIVLNHASKLDRILPNLNLRFHVKLYDIGGKVKYSFHARTKIGKETLLAEAADWDMRRTTHMAMEKLLTAVEHKLHVQGQKQQKFHPKKAKRGFGKNVKLKMRGRAKSI